jgi:hypothetical protein
MKLGSGRFSLETIGYYIALAILAGATWIYPFVFSDDGTVHAVNAQLITHLLKGDCPAASLLYRFNPFIVPNWTGHAVMAALIYGGATTVFAEKFLFSLCILTGALGFRYLLRVTGGNPILSWPLLGLSINIFLLAGVYNYTLGIGISFFILAWYLKRRQREAGFTALLALLLTLNWFSHIIAFLFTGMFILMHEIMLMLRHVRGRGIMSYIRDNLFMVAAFLPALALTAIYFLTPYKVQNIDYGNIVNDGLNGIYILTLFDFLPNFEKVTFQQTGSLMILGLLSIASLAWTLMSSLKTHKVLTPFATLLLLCVLILWLLSFFFQFSLMGGWLLDMRLRMLGWYMLFLTLSQIEMNKTQEHGFIYISILIAFFNLSFFVHHAKTTSAVVSTIRANMPQISDNSVVLTLDIPPPPSTLASATSSLSGHLLSDKKCVVDINNYEASLDYFPLRFKDDKVVSLLYQKPVHDKMRHTDLASMIKMDGVSMQKFKTKSGITVDYLFVIGNSHGLKDYSLAKSPDYAAYYLAHEHEYAIALQNDVYKDREMAYEFRYGNQDFFRLFRHSETNYKK